MFRSVALDKKMKNLYLWNKSIVTGTLIPLLWFSSKTYFEENGTTADQWSWQDPFIHEKSKEQILAQCEINPPTIFGFSLYVWNYIEADELAQEIRRRFPTCLIIYGGPQINIKFTNNFFVDKPWVNLVVPSDVYGEPIITHILDNFNNLKYSDIPEVYFHKMGIKFKSKHEFVKRSFKWPSNIFLAQQEFLNFEFKNSMAIYETTRGCPYRCIYCDWGGGTYTKVVKKPITTVYAELEFLAKKKIEFLSFADANFGIYKEDIEVIKYIVNLKNQYGYPKSVNIENAKNNLDRVIEIQKLLIENQLSYIYKISIQNPHDDIKNNIDRVDIPFDDHLAAVLKLKAEYNAPIMIETILGLPGDNYQRTLESIDMFANNDIESYRPAVWMLLPEAPAYDPVMRDKFKIETKWFEIYTHPFRYKPNIVHDDGVITLSGNNSMLAENVISTYSYSKHEWCDMLTLTMILGVAKTVGIDLLVRYISDKHNAAHSTIYDEIYREIIVKKAFTSDFLNDKMGGVPEYLYNMIDDETATKLEFDVGQDFPLLLGPNTYLLFIIMLDPGAFFRSLVAHFSVKYKDLAMIDLGNYLANISIDIDYDPVIKRIFISDYNWYSYFTDNKPLTSGKYEYKLLDNMLKFVGSIEFEEAGYTKETDYNQKIKQFFYHRASNQARKKYAQYISESRLA